MAKGKQSQRRRSRLSLSLRFSVLMLLAALLPLAVVVGVNDYFARQTLIKQSSDALSADANSSASRSEQGSISQRGACSSTVPC
jgi:Tfp pilus assembly protein PilN